MIGATIYAMYRRWMTVCEVVSLSQISLSVHSEKESEGGILPNRPGKQQAERPFALRRGDDEEGEQSRSEHRW